MKRTTKKQRRGERFGIVRFAKQLASLTPNQLQAIDGLVFSEQYAREHTRKNGKKRVKPRKGAAQ